MNESREKTIVVTGAEGALGGTVVECFLRHGHRVVGAHRPGHEPRLRGLANTAWYAMEGASAESVREGFSRVRADEGPIGTLVHCAGGFRFAPVDATTDEDFQFLVDGNFRAAFNLFRELLPEMKREGFGRIVVVSARSSLNPTAGVGVYTATKAALNALVAAAADEVKKFDITINAVAPTVIDTPANRKDMPDADWATWVTREQLAEVIYALTSSVGKPIHGAVIPVAGRV